MPPSDSICSRVSGRTSKPSTCAPRRLAVAIACRPATPAPTTSTLRRPDRAGGGGQHREEARRELRGDQHRLVAGHAGLRTQHVHRLRARGARQPLQRERQQFAVADRRGARIRACGASRPTTVAPVRSARKRVVGRWLHAQQQIGRRHDVVAARRVPRRPARRRRRRSPRPAPAPGSMRTRAPRATSLRTVSGVAATRRSPGARSRRMPAVTAVMRLLPGALPHRSGPRPRRRPSRRSGPEKQKAPRDDGAFVRSTPDQAA